MMPKSVFPSHGLNFAVERGLPMVKGLRKWIQWIDDRGIKKCAVTNAPRKNAEVMLEALGLE